MISSIALIVSCRQPFIVASVNLKDDPPRACWVEEKHIHSSCGQWKFWHLKPLTNQSICVLSPFLWLHSKRGDNLSALSVWCTVITCDLFDREPVISLIWPSVHGRSPPHPPPNQAAAWRVIAEPPCFDALDLYDLKSHFHFSDHRKKEHILLIAKRQIFSPLCSPLSFHRFWFPFESKTLKTISIFIHQCLSVIWRPLQPQSTSQLQPRGMQQWETINNRKKQFALMWSVFCCS